MAETLKSNGPGGCCCGPSPCGNYPAFPSPLNYTVSGAWRGSGHLIWDGTQVLWKPDAQLDISGSWMEANQGCTFGQIFLACVAGGVAPTYGWSVRIGGATSAGPCGSGAGIFVDTYQSSPLLISGRWRGGIGVDTGTYTISQ